MVCRNAERYCTQHDHLWNGANTECLRCGTKRDGADSTKPGAGAVTSEHREAAAVAWYHPYGWKHMQVIMWINSGLPNAGIAPSLILSAQAIAEAELRGQRTRDAEVDGLQRELAELRSQANEYGAHPGDIAGKGAVADEQLADDLRCVLCDLKILQQHRAEACADYDLSVMALQSLDRITAALARGGK